MLVGQIQVGFRCRQAVVTKNLFESRKRAAFTEKLAGKRMAGTCGVTLTEMRARLASSLTTFCTRRLPMGNESLRAKYGSKMLRTRADIGTTRALLLFPIGPPLPLILEGS